MNENIECVEVKYQLNNMLRLNENLKGCTRKRMIDKVMK
jgi:hypothetical protein